MHSLQVLQLKLTDAMSLNPVKEFGAVLHADSLG
jgi:hypothetical protein